MTARRATRRRGHFESGTSKTCGAAIDPALQQHVLDDAAWVAAYTGFEIQIDEKAAPDGTDQHRTGAVYNVPTGVGGLQNFAPAPP